MKAKRKASEKNAVRIRKAKSADAERLAMLSGQLGYPTPLAEIRRRLAKLLKNPAHCLLVAESPDRYVIGWLDVSADTLLEVPFRAEINGLVVDETVRSLGAGRTLLAAAETWARKRGCHNMSVRSNMIRDRAHRFYERNGYEHYKTQKAFRKPL